MFRGERVFFPAVEPARHRVALTPTTNNTIIFSQPECLRGRGHLKPESTVQDVQPSSDTVTKVVEEVDESESEFEFNEKARITFSPARARVIEQLARMITPGIEQVDQYPDGDSPYDADDEDDSVDQRLYAWVARDDREIASLRTIQRERFTHIVRIVCEPFSRRNYVTPSNWRIEEIIPRDGPSELRLTFPAAALHGTGLIMLTERQLLAARNYIAHVLPDTVDVSTGPGFAVELSPEERENSRVLVVGPPGRDMDVEAILLWYVEGKVSTRQTGRRGNNETGRDVVGYAQERPFSLRDHFEDPILVAYW